MARRFDHEKVNRKERARKQGTEQASSDFPVDPARTPAGRQLQKQLARAIDELLAGFALLTDDVRTKQAEAYRQRVTPIHDSERSRLTEANRLELAPILRVSGAAGWKRSERAFHGRLRLLESIRLGVGRSHRRGLPHTPESRRNSKTARAKAEGNRSLRSLETLKVEAAIVGGRLFVGWSDHAGADRWLLVVTARSRRLKQLTRPPEHLAATVDGIAVDYQPLRVRVYARRKRHILATGSAEATH